MTFQGVLEMLKICDNCQQTKDKGVVSFSAGFASTGDSPFRSMSAKDNKLLFSNFCSTWHSAVELWKNWMWGIFWCVSTSRGRGSTWNNLLWSGQGGADMMEGVCCHVINWCKLTASWVNKPCDDVRLQCNKTKLYSFSLHCLAWQFKLVEPDTFYIFR